MADGIPAYSVCLLDLSQRCPTRKVLSVFPVLMLLWWIVGLLSLAVLGGGGYLIYAWYNGIVVGTAYLVGGVLMVALSLLGRPLVLFLVGRPDADEPRMTREGRKQRVNAPDGTELHVEFYGPEDAPTIVMTHGWGMNSTVWYYAKRDLAKRFRLIVWDLPGLGESSEPTDKDYKLEKLAEYLAVVVGLAGDRPVVLLGHSIGGMITQTFCRLFPDQLGSRVVGLILVHTTYTDPAKTTFLKRLLHALEKPVLVPLMYLTVVLSPVVKLMNWLSYWNGSLHLVNAFTGFGSRPTRGQLEFTTLFQPISSPAVQARGDLAMFGFDESRTLPTIPIPTLVIAAHRDRLTIPEASAYIHEHIPASELVTLKPAGHSGFLEQHERFAELVTGFVEARTERA